VNFDTLAGLAGDLGAMGFILWLTHRLTTHTIPRLADTFEASVRQQRADFREALAEQRSDFREWNQREHENHLEQSKALVESMRELAREVRGKQ